MKRIFSLVCAFTLALAMIPLPVRAAESTLKDRIRSTVDSQIRSYASSISQSNAVNTAAKALAKHGLTQKGRKMTVGNSHALTAALWSTNILQEAMVEGCAQQISVMQEAEPTKTGYIKGHCVWRGDTSFYAIARVESINSIYYTHDMVLKSVGPYPGPKNSYDTAMDWVVGNVDVTVTLAWVKTTADSMEYQVTCKIHDRFDFDTARNSNFANFMSSLGAVLFREFDWESTVTFNLSVPYSCDHSSESYRWTFDPAGNTFTSHTDQGFAHNPVTHHTYENADSPSSYFELNETVELRCDEPWVLEYDVQQDKRILTGLAPHHMTSTIDPSLLLYGAACVCVTRSNRVYLSQADTEKYNQNTQYPREYQYYGAYYKGIFPYSTDIIYTFRLENQLNSDGSNMICLTILERDTGMVKVDRAPLDSFYSYQPWLENSIGTTSAKDWKDAQGWVSGKDIYVNYIGNKSQSFCETNFDLRIWENGKETPSGSSCTEVVTTPTCTAKGYTTYTCRSCGYAYKGSYTPAAGHTWGEWEALSPTLYERRCTGCGAAEQKTRLLPGDCNGDGTVNALDLIALRQHLAGWEVTIHAPDCNGDGTTNALDLIRLRQYLAGWDVTLGG